MTLDPEVEPLEPALVDALATERRPPSPPADSRARVLARLDASLGGGLLAPPSEGPSGASGGTGGRLLRYGAPIVALLVGIALGAAWSPRARSVVVVNAPDVNAAEPAPASAPPTMTMPTPTADPSPRMAESAPVAQPRESSTPAFAHPAASAERDDLTQERSLLDAARTALIRRDAPATLAMLQKHSARYPNGRLSEERDALMVQALVLDGRDDEARARAESFAKRYSHSLLLPSVRAAVASPGPPK